MLQLPSLPHMGVDPFLQAGSLQSAPSLGRPPKRERTPDSDDEVHAAEDGGKKKRKKRVKKDRVRSQSTPLVKVRFDLVAQDPNAPRRPGSAYIFFQNTVRNEMKELHPEVSYRELVTLISKRWADMPDAEKQVRLLPSPLRKESLTCVQPFQNEASEAMSTWKVDDAAFQKKVKDEGNGDVPATPTLNDVRRSHAVLKPTDKTQAIMFKTDDGSIAVPVRSPVRSQLFLMARTLMCGRTGQRRRGRRALASLLTRSSDCLDDCCASEARNGGRGTMQGCTSAMRYAIQRKSTDQESESKRLGLACEHHCQRPLEMQRYKTSSPNLKENC